MAGRNDNNRNPAIGVLGNLDEGCDAMLSYGLTVPESGDLRVGRHSQPCRAGIVLKFDYEVLPQIDGAKSSRVR